MIKTRRPRIMNEKQHRALDRIADLHPMAVVTGWMDDPGFGRGPVVQFLNGDRSLVNVTGHSKALAHAS